MFLAIWICSSGLKQFGKFQTHTVWRGSFAWKVIVSTKKVSDELLGMGKDLKIKHSVSSSPKEALQGGTNFSG